MARYAQSTTVSVESSRNEIERTLVRYGATGFMYGWQGDTAAIQFEAKGKRLKFMLPLPSRTLDEFIYTPTRGTARSPQDSLKAWEQSCRQRWRALALAIKAKLEAVEAGITSFESEFLAHIVLPNGGTVGQFMLPQVKTAYDTGKMPPMLPALEHTS